MPASMWFFSKGRTWATHSLARPLNILAGRCRLVIKKAFGKHFLSCAIFPGLVCRLSLKASGGDDAFAKKSLSKRSPFRSAAEPGRVRPIGHGYVKVFLGGGVTAKKGEGSTRSSGYWVRPIPVAPSSIKLR